MEEEVIKDEIETIMNDTIYMMDCWGGSIEGIDLAADKIAKYIKSLLKSK